MSRPARTGRMNLIFIHRPCGYEIGYPTREPVTRGLCCGRCDPACQRDASTDWRQVMADDLDASEITSRWSA